MDEKEKNEREQLQRYVEKYKVFIDTCSLLHPAVDAFWQHIVPVLQTAQKQIFMPYKCWLELEKHSQNSDPQKPDLASNAKKALATVQKLVDAGLISVRQSSWEKGGTFADHTFMAVFQMHRDKYDLLLITQDGKLAREIEDLNNSQADRSNHKILVQKIAPNGFLRSFDRRADASPGTHETNDLKGAKKDMNAFAAPPVKPPPAFKLCTRISRTASEPIRVSSIPGENDLVYANNGAIRLVRKIAAGGEGTIYETDTPYVAKIYHNGKLTERSREKLRKLLDKQLKCEGICFPVAGLYNRNKEFVGYLMPKAKGKELQRSIFIKPLFLQCFPGWKKKDLVALCITILNKIQYLHDQNIIMGDINAGNILVVSTDEVYFVDTDSYQIEDLPCPVGTDTFTAPEIVGKDCKSFLRTMGNEYFAIATLLFMMMLPGKSPYAQKGGADPVANIIHMDFSYPFEERSNKKTPAGPWGYCWSHLPYKLKEAFYKTFQKGEAFSTESTRLPTSEWIILFNQYYYELTDPKGNMLKNDAMSGEIFPTRFKKRLDATYIVCRLCGKETDAAYTKNGICKACLSRTYQTAVCAACGNRFDISYGEKAFFEQKGFELPKRCPNCRKNDVSAKNTHASQSSTSFFDTSFFNSVPQTPFQPQSAPPAKPKAPAKPKVPAKPKAPAQPKQSPWQKKKQRAQNEIQAKFNECISAIKSDGFHPFRERKVRKYFQELIIKVDRCRDDYLLEQYLEKAAEFDVYDMDDVDVLLEELQELEDLFNG